MAQELEQMASATGATAKDILDILLYIGKKAMGREVKITDENKLEVSISLQRFPKIAPLNPDSK
jgi:hypothetical protein